MKKSLLIATLALFSYSSSAQVFKIGVSAGASTNDAKNVSGWALGVDAYYMFKNSGALLNIGPSVGYRNYFVDQSGFDDLKFLPVSAALRVSIFGILQGGIDAGYAFGLTDGLDGGFYFRPIIAFGILGIFELNFSYESISSDFENVNRNWGVVNAGLLLRL